MQADIYVLILHATVAKTMFTSRRLYTVLSALVPLAAAVHVVYPLNRYVINARPACIARTNGSVPYEIHSHSGWGFTNTCRFIQLLQVTIGL